MTVLHELLRDAEAAESVFDETNDPELGDAAYMDVIAARNQIRAELRRGSEGCWDRDSEH